MNGKLGVGTTLSFSCLPRFSTAVNSSEKRWLLRDQILSFKILTLKEKNLPKFGTVMSIREAHRKSPKLSSFVKWRKNMEPNNIFVSFSNWS